MATDPDLPDASAARWAPSIGVLARAVGIAADPRKLILAGLGLIVYRAGLLPFEPLTFRLAPPIDRFDILAGDVWIELAGRVAEPARAVVSPFRQVFARGIGWHGFARSTLIGLWAVVVWGLAGGAIARIAVVEAATGRKLGLGTAARFALGRAVALIAAPLTPMVAVAFFAAGCALFGLLYRIPGGVGSTIAAIFTFLPLLAGLGMTLILLGLAAAWPLMHATVAAEGEDTPDALSRSYAYVNQRLPRYAILAATSWTIGAVGLGLAILFARAVLALSDWGVALGAPDAVTTTDLSHTIRGVWLSAVALLVQAWTYSYFWSAASIIYLLLRRDVDGTEIHDVYLPEHDADTFAGEPAVSSLPHAEASTVSDPAEG